MTASINGSARSVTGWQKLVIDVVRTLGDRKARVVLDSDFGTWVEIDRDGFPLLISTWPEASPLGVDLIVCRAPVYDEIAVDAKLYRWLATDAQTSLSVKLMLAPMVSEMQMGFSRLSNNERRRTRAMLDAVWVAPLPGMDAETMANGLSELALVAASSRAYIDTRGGGVPAFERLVASGFAALDPIEEPYSHATPTLDH